MSTDQPKVERLLRLMQMMSGSVNYSIDELADRLEMSKRTIYRYIETFKDAGFVVGKVHDDVYRIFKMARNAPEFDKLICFSDEEAYLVNSLLDRLDPTNALKGNLKRKLATIYDHTGIADFVDKKENASNIESLSNAIRDHRKVILRSYESGASLTTRDRFVEPFGFTTNYVDVWAYDLENNTNKVFKISRIGSVEITDEEWTNEESHKEKFQDVFRMTGDPIDHIKLYMSPMAKNLLLEESPLAEQFLTPEGDDWILETDIASVYGVGRFVMGLPMDVQILEGEQVRDYIRSMVQDFLSEI